MVEPQRTEAQEAGAAAPALGMTMDEARALLQREHKTPLGDDDPILMLITIHNAFLNDFAGLLERHNNAAVEIFGETLEAGRLRLEEESKKLAGLASGQTARELREAARAVETAVRETRASVRACTICMLAVGAGMIATAVAMLRFFPHG